MRALGSATGRNENWSRADAEQSFACRTGRPDRGTRGNIRQLIEQAAAASGGQNEERIADRIAQQTAELDKLVLEREELGRK